MTVFVFPGQGSQKKGMGDSLFDEFNDLTAKADAILGYSIKDLCLKDEGSRLSRTEYTQPALFVVNALSYLRLMSQSRRRPDYAAGHSLGEYSALFAAGAFDFETGLRLVWKRGELMAKAVGGGMAAVVGVDEATINRVLKENRLDAIDVANYNAPGQIVISGPKDLILSAKSAFESAGARYAALHVSGAFHSRHMKLAEDEFSNYLDKFDYRDLQIPVVANVDASLYSKERIRELLSRQLIQPVRWTETIRFLLSKGEADFTEVGPGAVLTKLIEKIRQQPAPPPTETPRSVCLPPNQADQECPVVAISNNVGKVGKVGESVKVVPTNGSASARREKPGEFKIRPESLGDDDFKRDYNLKYAYVAGGANIGAPALEIVLRMARAGLIGYFGTGGLRLQQIYEGIRRLAGELNDGASYGVSLVFNPGALHIEDSIVDLLLEQAVRNVEASAYIQITPALVRYRLQGLTAGPTGLVIAQNRILARVSRLELAEAFLSPAPERIVRKLLSENKVTQKQADLAGRVPMADDLCVGSDSVTFAHHTTTHALMPVIQRLRDEAMKQHGYGKRIRIGKAGGVGTPAAAAAAFIEGADFILADSINQCSVEGELSEVAKDLLERMSVQDAEQVPSADLFELGGKTDVLKRGVLFPARANKLYDIYRRYNSLDEIDERTRTQLQEQYFKSSFDDVYREVRRGLADDSPDEIEKAENNPKHKMALIFKWYLKSAQLLALNGADSRVDYQIPCSPALGAFNQSVKGTPLEKWRNRRVDDIAEWLMEGAARFSAGQIELLLNRN
ncbi:MAG: ACP S-malonyltransferase [Chloracidobacterium sp.]|nr:ACP S-malonyltransferase [Chloracidobacterium sp.]